MTGWEVDPQAMLAESARRGGSSSSLATALLASLNPDGNRPVELRHGKVVSFSTTTWQATVTIAGTTTQVPGVPHLHDYPLQANDPVWLVKYGPGYMVMGSPVAAGRWSTPIVQAAVKDPGISSMSPYGIVTNFARTGRMVTLNVEVQVGLDYAVGWGILWTPDAMFNPRDRVWVNCSSPFAPHRHYALAMGTNGVVTTQHAIPNTEVLLGHITYPAAN